MIVWGFIETGLRIPDRRCVVRSSNQRLDAPIHATVDTAGESLLGFGLGERLVVWGGKSHLVVLRSRLGIGFMSFFEPPPPPPEEELQVHRQPTWIGPPDNVLGVGLPIRLVLVRTDELAVLIDHVSAYPTGFTFELSLNLREEPESPMDLDEVIHGSVRWSRKGSQELSPELFRFGIRFADGSKVTNVNPGAWPREKDEAPSGPFLVGRSGGGGGTRWEQGFWVWPLPPDGPLAFVCEWPARGVPMTEHEVDATAIREAASRTEVLWQGEPPAHRGGVWY